MHGRICVLSVCADAAAQYVAVMNAIFAAQKCDVLVDGCDLGATSSSFLRQAAHLTGGVYMHLPQLADARALLVHLLSVYAADVTCREAMVQPAQATVDFRAACFCHHRPMDVAFVCSVCLSIFCGQPEVCSSCGSRNVQPRTEIREAAAAAAAT